METTKLKFSKQDGGSYVCKIASSESEGLSGVVQITQAKRGIVSILANIPDMEPTVVGNLKNPYGSSVIFELALPAGVDVTIKSETEVTNALWKK